MIPMSSNYKSGLAWPNEEIGLQFRDLYGTCWSGGSRSHELKEAVRVRKARSPDWGY